MKEKLRKLDGKPTEPGSYRYTEDGWDGDAILAVFYSACNRLYADNDSGVAGWVDELPGQWSERIPDCDWEGEEPPKGKAVTCRTIPLTEAQRKGLTIGKEAAEAFKRARIK